MKRKKIEWKSIILGILISFGCFFDQSSLYQHTFQPRSPFMIDLFSVSLITILFILIYQAWKTHKLHPLKIVFVLFLSCFMLIGESFHKIDSLRMLHQTPLLCMVTVFRMLGYFALFYVILVKIDDFLQQKEKEEKITSKFLLYFNDHPVKTSFFVLTLCWSIYIVAFYPIVLSPDPSYQILQFFNIPTKYMTYILPLSSNVNLTNHHPVIHTMLLGGCLKLGRFFGSDNVGLFMYSMFQTFILMSALICTIVSLKKENVSTRKRFFVLLIYALVPMFPLYAMSGVKDTLYTAFMIFYCLALYYILNKKVSFQIKHWLFFFILLCLVALFRNNGIYIILLSLPWIILYEQRYRKVLTILFVIFMGSYFSYDKILLPGLKITSGSTREMLSIPFQQTARLAHEHPESFSRKEKKIVDKVLGFDTLGDRYKPEISDPVKNEYNPHTTKRELKQYFEVWLHGLLKYPNVYVEATLNNTYGYFYPGHTRWYIYTKYYPLIKEEGVVDYRYNSCASLRKTLAAYGNVFPYIPGIGLLSNIGWNTLVLLFISIYSFIKKQWSYLLCLIPLLATLLVCLASPVNAYFRYAMPYIFLMPWCVMIFIKQHQEKNG